MSQPASLKEPRYKETVLACPHEWGWRSKAVYIGHHSGIGALVKTVHGQVFIRWVVLCWRCRLWRWLLRQRPLQRAKREMVWTVEGGDDA